MKAWGSEWRLVVGRFAQQRRFYPDEEGEVACCVSKTDCAAPVRTARQVVGSVVGPAFGSVVGSVVGPGIGWVSRSVSRRALQWPAAPGRLLR